MIKIVAGDSEYAMAHYQPAANCTSRTRASRLLRPPSNTGPGTSNATTPRS
jgi:hypothetical protein